MNDRIYNVIWIDDDGTLFTEDKLNDYLTDYNCRILNESEDSHNLGGDTKGLMASLKKYGHMVDAIILDLNFDYDGKQDVDKQTIEGFKSSMMALISNHEYKNIPVFVLSAEPQFIRRKEIPQDFRDEPT